MVNVVAKIMKARMLTLLQLKRSKAAIKEKTYTNTKFASFIICKKATDECKYAVLLRTSCAEKNNAMGKAPVRIRLESTVTFCAGSVNDGKSEGLNKYNIPAHTEQKIACKSTRQIAYGKRSMSMRYLLYAMRHEEQPMYPRPRRPTNIM